MATKSGKRAMRRLHRRNIDNDVDLPVKVGIWVVKFISKGMNFFGKVLIVSAASFASVLIPSSAICSSGTCSYCKEYADGNFYMKCCGRLYGGGCVYKKCS